MDKPIRRKYMKRVLFLVPVAALLFGCATTSGTSDSSGNGKAGLKEKVTDAAKKAVEASEDAVVTGDWELRPIGEAQGQMAATMTVADEGKNRYTLQGFSGVNTFSGSLTIGNDGAITVDKKIATTRMAGSADQMKGESAFLDALKQSTSWKAVRVGVETLEMKGASTTLRFTRLSIADRIWNLNAQLNDKGTAVEDIGDAGRKVTLMIAKGKANVFTGLNITNADCTLDEAEHTIAVAMASGAMTLASGSAEEMERERIYLNNLNAAATYTISGKTLSIQDANGKTVLVFDAQDLI